MKRMVLVCAFTASTAFAAVDVDALWNFNDPAASEARFREALIKAQGDDALVLSTQIARTLGLRQRYEEAHRELDAVEAAARDAGAAVRVRVALERGRVLRRPANRWKASRCSCVPSRRPMQTSSNAWPLMRCT